MSKRKARVPFETPRDNVVVPFRSRSQVRRSIERFRSAPPLFSFEEQVPVRIDPRVQVHLLLRGMTAAGLEHKYDERTHAIVILPKEKKEATL